MAVENQAGIPAKHRSNAECSEELSLEPCSQLSTESDEALLSGSTASALDTLFSLSFAPVLNERFIKMCLCQIIGKNQTEILKDRYVQSRNAKILRKKNQTGLLPFFFFSRSNERFTWVLLISSFSNGWKHLIYFGAYSSDISGNQELRLSLQIPQLWPELQQPAYPVVSLPSLSKHSVHTTGLLNETFFLFPKRFNCHLERSMISFEPGSASGMFVFCGFFFCFLVDGSVDMSCSLLQGVSPADAEKYFII